MLVVQGVAGTLLIVATLLDVFQSVVTPRPVAGRIRISRYLTRSLWAGTRWLASRPATRIGTSSTRGGGRGWMPSACRPRSRSMSCAVATRLLSVTADGQSRGRRHDAADALVGTQQLLGAGDNALNTRIGDRTVRGVDDNLKRSTGQAGELLVNKMACRDRLRP